MKKIYKIIPFILLFAILFNSVSFAASGSGTGNTFINGFPLQTDESLYSSTSTPYIYNFAPSISDLLDSALAYYNKNKSTDIYSSDIGYILFYRSEKQLYLLFWDKEFAPDIRFDTFDAYEQLVFTPALSDRADGFSFGAISMFAQSTSTKITFSASGYNSDYIASYYRWCPESSDNYCFRPSSSGWYTYVYPICHFGADLPFEKYGYDCYLFPPESIEDDSEVPDVDDELIPDLPEDTDSNIVTLIKNIAYFFSQLFKKLTSLFSSLINKIEEFIQNVIDSISSVLDGIKEFFGKFISIFDSMYDFGVDSFGKFSIVRMIEKLFLPDDAYFFDKLNSFFHTHFEWLIQAKQIFDNIVDSLKVCADSSESPQIVIPAGTYGYFVLDHDIVWNFDWYIPYKPTVDAVISAFIILFFVYRLLTSLPDIINGSGSPFSAAPFMGDLERGYKKGRSINITISNKKGG